MTTPPVLVQEDPAPAGAAMKCAAEMVATYYEDQFCQQIHSFESLDNWDDGDCEPNKAYRGFNTWSCSATGVTENVYWDDKCKTKMAHANHAWGSCYPSLEGDYFVKYTQKANPTY